MVTPAMDIYSFGMCALETAALEIQGNGDSGSHVTDEHIARTVESLEEPRQKDFIYRYGPAPTGRSEITAIHDNILFFVRFQLSLVFSPISASIVQRADTALVKSQQ